MGYSFGKRSLSALATCHPALQAVAHRALELSAVDFTVTEGHRGRAAQEAAFAAKKSKAHFGESFHNFIPSRALDVVPYPVDWDDVRKFREIALAFDQAARELGVVLRWGGDFESFRDYPHFEIDEPGADWTPKASGAFASAAACKHALPVASRAALAYVPAADLLARVIWGECRGMDAAEARAIAHVVMNRVARPRGWGTDVTSVCLHPRQFSCLNADDPNLPKILAGDFADGDWETCQREARDAMAGASTDPTRNAVGYHAASMATYPKWARNMVMTGRIGGHLFYRERSR